MQYSPNVCFCLIICLFQFMHLFHNCLHLIFHMFLSVQNFTLLFSDINIASEPKHRPTNKTSSTSQASRYSYKYVNNVFFWFIYFRQVIITLYIKKLSISAWAYFEVCLKLWWTRELDNTGNNALPTQTYYMGWDEHLSNVWFAVSTADSWKMCTVTFHGKMSRLLFQFIPQCRQQVLNYFIIFSSCSDVLYLFSGASRVLNTQSGPPAKKQRTDSGMGGIKRTLVNLTSGNSSSAPASKSITQLAQGKARLLLNIAVYVD